MSEVARLACCQLVPFKHVLGTKEYNRRIQQCLPEIDPFSLFATSQRSDGTEIRFSYVTYF
jgi:hypothetical protein